jgi:hypothetical protein
VDVLALDRIGDDLVRKTKLAGRLLVNSVRGDPSMTIKFNKFKSLAKKELKRARATYTAKWQNLWFSVPASGKTNTNVVNCSPTCVLQNNQALKADLTGSAVSIAGNADNLLRRIPKNAPKKIREKAKKLSAQLVIEIDKYKKFLSALPDLSCKS